MIRNNLESTIKSLINDSKIHLSSINPSDWYEQNMLMPRGSAFPGKFSFDLTPYWREPLDCASPHHPAKEVSIMKGAQLGGTVAVLNPIVGYTISQYPGNIMFLTGHSDLTEASIIKIDHMIDNCGMRKLIKPTVLRAKNSRSGDTNKSKEFAGGDLKSGSVTNHNLLRQHDVMIMIVDDYDAASQASKFAGSTRELVQKRTSAYAHKKKIYWVSSPQLKDSSNIEKVFLLGDQRYYNVPCPKCGEFIVLKWSIDIEGTDGKEKGGIFYKTENNRVLKNSVGYICQKCSNFFDDAKKYEMNINGFWHPTAEAQEEDHYSYQISSLYAPPGMDSWDYYAQQYVNANPENEAIDESKNQTFVNVVLGETYEPTGREIKANVLQKNTRNYEIGILPDKMSVDDGNGHIILITCACDLNGKLEDARLDYEVVAWSESGSSYSIDHGSIGTFVFNEKSKKIDKSREKWTYEHHKPNSVWGEFKKVIEKVYETDTGRKMKILITGVDTGYMDSYAWDFIDNKANGLVVGLKGKSRDDEITKIGRDVRYFDYGKSRKNLFLLEGNKLKDLLASYIALKWDEKESQSAGFMNFPTPSNGLYLYNNYFSHYEAEHRVVENKNNTSIGFVWKKKTSASQNHLFDCRYYNLALKHIITELVCREAKIKDFTWNDFVGMIVK